MDLLAELRQRQQKMAAKKGNNATEKVIERATKLGNSAGKSPQMIAREIVSESSSAKTRHNNSSGDFVTNPTTAADKLTRTSSTLSTGSSGARRRRKRAPRTMMPPQDINAKLDQLKEDRIVGANAAATSSLAQDRGSGTNSKSSANPVDVKAILMEKRVNKHSTAVDDSSAGDKTVTSRAPTREPRVIPGMINPFVMQPSPGNFAASSSTLRAPTTPSSTVSSSTSSPSTPSNRRIKRKKRAAQTVNLGVEILDSFETERVVGDAKAVGESITSLSPQQNKLKTTLVTSPVPPISQKLPYPNQEEESYSNSEESEATSEEDSSDEDSSMEEVTPVIPGTFEPPTRKITRSKSTTTIAVGRMKKKISARFSVGPIIGACTDSSVRLLVECPIAIPLLQCKLVPLNATGEDAPRKSFQISKRVAANKMTIFSVSNLPEATQFRVEWDKITSGTGAPQIVQSASSINSKIAMVNKYSSVVAQELKNQHPHLLLHTNLLSNAKSHALCEECKKVVQAARSGTGTKQADSWLQSAPLKRTLISIFENGYKEALQQVEVHSVMRDFSNMVLFVAPYREGVFSTESSEYLINTAARVAYWTTVRLLQMDAPSTAEASIQAFLNTESSIFRMQMRRLSHETPSIIVLDHIVQQHFLQKRRGIHEGKSLGDTELSVWLEDALQATSPSQNLIIISHGASQQQMAQYLPRIIKSHFPFRSNVTIVLCGAEQGDIKSAMDFSWEADLRFEFSSCGRWLQLGGEEPSSDLDEKNTFSLHNPRKRQASTMLCLDTRQKIQ
mmetsp:Transcript_11083/g.41380  ORF Transcript_11083/g.41380 Transcript_11083/m.41380 type:complete len:788 (-) Transcript_11083:1871-4234(-)|eukprot:CAMPEP_0117440900 /NCGR_PEP_ID=MMETSP0759-20121206/3339_1 /TAXON_ID=63605 /ORGANISM="Percolomonas cosmopolitus, Strain WS" /LENGTH=787 /DNA_ID=CAMNT_0005232701 /DNA_START=151 /DNA_END=2514 /DNA_ORIENTATION=+